MKWEGEWIWVKRKQVYKFGVKDHIISTLMIIGATLLCVGLFLISKIRFDINL